MLLDTENRLGGALEYDVVPTGVFADRDGAVRYVRRGTFDVADSKTLAALEHFAAGDLAWLARESDQAVAVDRTVLGRELTHTTLGLAADWLAQGREEDALAELDRVLALDPDNFIVRKQRWLIRHPERFTPEIDWKWQTEQLGRELRNEEAAENDSGPD